MTKTKQTSKEQTLLNRIIQHNKTINNNPKHNHWHKFSKEHKYIYDIIIDLRIKEKFNLKGITLGGNYRDFRKTYKDTQGLGKYNGKRKQKEQYYE